LRFLRYIKEIVESWPGHQRLAFGGGLYAVENGIESFRIRCL